MTAITTAVALSGLDEIDARRHLTSALVDALDDIDTANGHERFDGDENRCVDYATEAVAADLVTNLSHATDALAGVANLVGAIADPTIRTAVIKARQQLANAAETAEALRRSLQAGCSHSCATAALPHAEADRYACDLIDRLDAAGYTLARDPGGSIR
jgi:hypothetical protein